MSVFGIMLQSNEVNNMAKNSKNRFSWGGTHPLIYHPFLSYFTPDLKNKVILDCGSGKGMNGYLIRVTRDLKGAKLIGLDINKYYMDFCRKHKIYDKLVKHYLPTLPFVDKSIDFLICTEVIEHLDKDKGKKLLSEIDRVCRGRALVTTPNIFFDTEPGEEEDAHHSLWTPEDFKKRGYKVCGLGLKTPLLHGDPFLRVKQALYFLFTPFSYFFPEIGAGLICIKDFDK